MNFQITRRRDRGTGADGEAGLSRRALLGGFALSASGLFLPASREQTEARDGAAGGQLGGRHGKDHRGRNGDRHRHRRDRDKDPDRHPPKGILDNEGVLNIEFIFVNNNVAGTGPIGVTCYSYDWGTHAVLSSEVKSVRAETGVDFKTSVKHASLYFDHDRHVVWARNPFYDYPTIEITSAGGRVTVGPRAMAEGDVCSSRYGTAKIDVTRLRDAEGYKVFSVNYEG